MMTELVSRFTRRGSRPAKARQEASNSEDNLARLRADLDYQKTRKHVKKCLKEKHKRYRIEEFFAIYADMSSDEQESFKALYEKTKRPVSRQWWMDFDNLWAKLWLTGSVSKKLMAKNGCNPHDDGLPGVVKAKPKHELIVEFERDMDCGPVSIFGRLRDPRNMWFFDEHDVLYYMSAEQKNSLYWLYAKRDDSDENRQEWNEAWGEFCLSMEGTSELKYKRKRRGSW